MSKVHPPEQALKYEQIARGLRADARAAREQGLAGTYEAYSKEAAEYERLAMALRKEAEQAAFTDDEKAKIEAALARIKAGGVTKKEVRAQVKTIRDQAERQRKTLARSEGKALSGAAQRNYDALALELVQTERLLKMYEHVLEVAEFPKGSRR